MNKKPKQLKKKKVVRKTSSKGRGWKLYDNDQLCTKCRNPFESHHHKHITKEGMFHTGCYEKENICCVKGCKNIQCSNYKTLSEEKLAQAIHKSDAVKVKREQQLLKDGYELEKREWCITCGTIDCKNDCQTWQGLHRRQKEVIYPNTTKPSLWKRFKDFLNIFKP